MLVKHSKLFAALYPDVVSRNNKQAQKHRKANAVKETTGLLGGFLRAIKP